VKSSQTRPPRSPSSSPTTCCPAAGLAPSFPGPARVPPCSGISWPPCTRPARWDWPSARPNFCRYWPR